jgi:hypothetical protein
LEFAENSPFPPPELSEQGVYCENGCHTIEADWKRPKSEVMPPKSSVAAVWKVEGFGGGAADAKGSESTSASAQGNGAKSPAAAKAAGNASQNAKSGTKSGANSGSNSGKKPHAKKVVARKGRG